jgi:hypothetical protein
MKYWNLSPERRAVLRKEWNRPILWPAWAMLAVVAIAGVLSVWRWRRDG